MTDPSRRERGQRATRRPGWVLLTTLLVLAIVASSALVFTDEVQLLKLAVVLALWAAVAAAFVSFIYRRQADVDKARMRDLKTVYNLQLDREISARREYELSVESHLRRELAAELRAQSADEVAALRAELAALRTHLEILFDTDLEHRPALGPTPGAEPAALQQTPAAERAARAERVIASRIDTEDRAVEWEPTTEESPIIDVAAEPHPNDEGWNQQSAPQAGAHRRAQEAAQAQQVPPPGGYQAAAQQVAQVPPAPGADWQPLAAEGQWIPAGAPGSNWVAPVAEDDRVSQVVPDDRVSQVVPDDRGPEPTMTLPPVPPAPTGRRHRSPDEASEQPPAPALAVPPVEPEPAPRHRSRDEEEVEQRAGGQSAAELLARLQVNVGEGGRRRRRED